RHARFPTSTLDRPRVAAQVLVHRQGDFLPTQAKHQDAFLSELFGQGWMKKLFEHRRVAMSQHFHQAAAQCLNAIPTAGAEPLVRQCPETGGRHRYLQSRLALPLVGRRERLAPHVQIGIQNAKRYAKVLELRYLLLKSVAQWLAEPFQ